VEQVENTVTGMEDKVQELDQRSWKITKKIWIEYARLLGHHQKTKPMNHGHRRQRRDTN
jgi:hypothetical protein